MKRIFLILFVSFLAAALYPQVCQIDWNRPWLVSTNNSSLLDHVQYEEQLFLKHLNRPQEEGSDLTFAFASFTQFKQALRNFFSTSDDSSLLYYRSPDKYQPDPVSSSLLASNIPLSSMLNFSLISGVDHVLEDEASYSFLYYGTRLAGFINRRLFFTSEWWAGHFTGDIDKAVGSNLIDSWYQFPDDGSELYLDNMKARITYRGKGDFWTVSLGRGKYQLGSNIGGSIILNDACNDYGYFSSKFKFKKFYVSYLHGALIPDSTSINNLKNVADKFIAVHKIGWTPTSNFEIFAGEEIIYANRSLDPSYLLPHTFWRATEHNLSDRDNALIFLGSNYRPVPGVLLYANFLLDELKKSKIFTKWWGNKYAFQLGSSFVLSEPRNASISCEFTAVRPWIYTHYQLENRFSHDDISLGFPSGSNLIQYTAEINFNVLPVLNSIPGFSINVRAVSGTVLRSIIMIDLQIKLHGWKVTLQILSRSLL